MLEEPRRSYDSYFDYLRKREKETGYEQGFREGVISAQLDILTKESSRLDPGLMGHLGGLSLQQGEYARALEEMLDYYCFLETYEDLTVDKITEHVIMESEFLHMRGTLMLFRETMERLGEAEEGEQRDAGGETRRDSVREAVLDGAGPKDTDVGPQGEIGGGISDSEV